MLGLVCLVHSHFCPTKNNVDTVQLFGSCSSFSYEERVVLNC